MKVLGNMSKALIGGCVVFLIIFTLVNQAAAQTCTTAPVGLIGWWDGDAVAGTTAIDIQGANDGTLVNGATTAPGFVGDAFSFDGVNDFIQLPFDSGIFTNQFTIDAWAFPTKLVGGANLQGIFDNDVSGNRGMGLDVFNSPLLVTGFFHNSSGTQFNLGNIPTTDNQWNHYAVTYDGNQLCFYQNGVKENCIAAAGTVRDNNVNFRIGDGQFDGSTARFYGGLIDEVEIYNRALSGPATNCTNNPNNEICDIFLAGSAGKCKSHFKCYQVVKETPVFEELNVFLSDQFEDKDTTVKVPTLVCNPVDKDGEGINNPDFHLTCYKIKQVKGQTPFNKRNVLIDNQFGELTLVVGKPQLLCVPSGKIDLATKTVFVTSTLHKGNLGGLAGADAICQARADAAGLGGTYFAWLSDAVNSPDTRFTKATAPYKLVDGTTVADNYADLTDGSLDAGITLHADGSMAPMGGAFAWSNTTQTGTSDGAPDCVAWTVGVFGPPLFATGSTSASFGTTTSNWSNQFPGCCACDSSRNLFCFGQ